MSNDREPSQSQERQVSLVQEFNAALQKTKKDHEPASLVDKWKLRHRGQLLATVQFGSMVNGNPRIDQNGVLLSDVDIMLIYAGTSLPYREADPRGLTERDNGPFSEHIPNADILLHNVRDILDQMYKDKTEILRELKNLKKALEVNSPTRSAHWMFEKDGALIDSFAERLAKYTIMPQILLGGEITTERANKPIPPEIFQAAEDLMETLESAVAEMRQLKDALPPDQQ